jgi:hypothetical protein
MIEDAIKPSRANRRQKRTWKRQQPKDKAPKLAGIRRFGNSIEAGASGFDSIPGGQS